MQEHPPYRADQVGSLLRPAALAQLRVRHKQGEVDAATLRRVEDDAVRDAVRQQEAIGLRSVTDGEFRRDWWHLDFLTQLDGVASVVHTGPEFGGPRNSRRSPPSWVAVRCSRPIMVGGLRVPEIDRDRDAEDDDTVAVDAASARRPQCISREVVTPISKSSGPTSPPRTARPSRTWPAPAARYLQLDDVAFAYLCDPKMRQNCRRNGDDPDELPRRYAATIDAALAGGPRT